MHPSSSGRAHSQALSLVRSTKIKFSPTKNQVAVGAWDGTVRIYDVDARARGINKAAYSHGSAFHSSLAPSLKLTELGRRNPRHQVVERRREGAERSVRWDNSAV